jgi:hypothetical protein
MKTYHEEVEGSWTSSMMFLRGHQSIETIQNKKGDGGNACRETDKTER